MLNDKLAKITPAQNAAIYVVIALATAMVCNLAIALATGSPFAPDWPLTIATTVCCAVVGYLDIARKEEKH